MKRNMRTPILAVVLAGTLVAGAAAATVQRITADLRPDITVKVDGEKQTMYDNQGNQVYPITYNGTTYLPIRALGNVLGQEVSWDSKTQTVSLTAKKSETSPEDITLEKLEARVKDAEKMVSDLVAASTYEGRVRQYDQLSPILETLRADVNTLQEDLNDDLRSGEISYTDYNDKSQRAGDLDVRMKDAQAALEKKTIADTSGKQTIVNELSAELKDIESQVDSLKQKVSDLDPNNAYYSRDELWSMYGGTMEDLRDQVYNVTTRLNDHLRNQQISFSDYNSLSQRANQADVTLKDSLADLQDKLFNNTSGWTDYKTAEKQVKDLENRMTTLEKEITDLTPASTKDGRQSQYDTQNKKLTQLSTDTNDFMSILNDALLQSKISNSDYNALSQRAGSVDVRVKDARSDLADKTINRTDSQTGTLYDSYKTRLDDLNTQTDDQVKASEDSHPGPGNWGNRDHWKQIEKKADALDDDLEDVEDDIKRDYRKGSLTYDEYRDLKQYVDSIDEKLDYIDDLYDD